MGATALIFYDESLPRTVVDSYAESRALERKHDSLNGTQIFNILDISHFTCARCEETF